MKQIIDHKTIKLPVNYLAILPDKDFDKFHNDRGEETEIFAPTSVMVDAKPNSEDDFSQRELVDTFSMNMSYSGTVIAIPDRLIFNGRKIKKLFKDHGDKMENRRYAMHIASIAQKMRDDSVSHDVDIDVKPGDRVYYDYLEKFTVYKEGRVIKTDIGDLYLIKYDKLELRIRDNEIKPLNSWVFVEWSRKTTLKYGSLELEGLDKPIEQTKGVHKARIVAMSDPAKHHVDDPDYDDPINHLNIGDIAMFSSGSATNLENENHYTLFGGREIMKVRSTDILALWQT